jgi:TP901 family phage tail tape measure protein/lambda family phage tail tape measure protein
MSTSKNLVIKLRVDDNGTARVINHTKSSLTRLGHTGSTAGRTIASGMDRAHASTMNLGTVAKVAMGYFTARHVAEFVSTVSRIGAGFEQTMAVVGGVSRASKGELQLLTAAARQMGEQTEWSAAQSAEALKYLAMAGFDVHKSIAALPGVLDLATAGQMDLGSAADIVTDSLTALGLGVNDLSRLSDVMVGTITRSNTNIGLMGESLKYVAPIAHALGYEVEQTAAMIGALANAGIKGSDSGTDLRQAMLHNKRAAKELGTEADDLIGTIKAANAAGWDANRVQEEWGMIASKSVLVLMDNVEQYEQLEAQLRNVEGETKTLARTMQDTASGAWKNFQSAVESVKLDLFARESSAAKDAIFDLAQEIRDNKDEIVDGLSAIGTAAVHVAEALSTVVKYAGLRSVAETFAEGLELSQAGAFSLEEFRAAGYLERQHMVDAAKKTFNAATADIQKQIAEHQKKIADAQKVMQSQFVTPGSRMWQLYSQKIAISERALKKLNSELSVAKDRSALVHAAQSSPKGAAGSTSAALPATAGAVGSPPSPPTSSGSGSSKSRATATSLDLDGYGTSALAALRAQSQRELDVLRAKLDNELSIAQRGYDAGTTGLEEYYAERRRVIEDGAAAEIAAQEGAISKAQAEQERLRQLDPGGARGQEQISDQVRALDEKIADAQARIAVLKTQTSTAIADLAAEQATAARDRIDQTMADAQAIISATEQSLQSRVITGLETESTARAKLKAAIGEQAQALQSELVPQIERLMLVASNPLARAELQAILDKIREMQAAARNQTWLDGLKQGVADYGATAKDSFQTARDAATSAFQGAENAVVQFAKTGKIEVSDMVTTINAEIARLAFRQMVSQSYDWLGGLLQTGLSAASSYFGGGASMAAGAAGSGFNYAGELSSFFSMNAKGNAYQSPSLSAYSGRIYNSPQLFAFAQGAGVFAEDGWEGIFPLRRTATGDLGVQAIGGGSDPETKSLLRELIAATRAQKAQKNVFAFDRRTVANELSGAEGEQMTLNHVRRNASAIGRILGIR